MPDVTPSLHPGEVRRWVAFDQHKFSIVAGVLPPEGGKPEAFRIETTAVIHRKVSLGTQSKTGERFAERALSAAATCRQQRRSLFTYPSELLTAHNRGDPFPALAA
jgi:hypothetical protein